MATPEPSLPDEQRWYHDITRYQWTVLIIASLGWVFDIFEGQIFVASMNEAMDALVPQGTAPGTKDNYKQITFALFLLGGASGGVVFGMMSDRIGRKKTMTMTIVMYSLFTWLSAFSLEWWHMAGFRFLVAMGVGGEWAVASSLVAEVFPERARARVSGIFHASSVFGTWMATGVATLFIGSEPIKRFFEDQGYPTLTWRLGFGMGVLPALLIIWIRRSLKEPDSWEQAKSRADQGTAAALGRIPELFRGTLLRPTIVGVSLAAIGMATFWGAHVFGKNLLRRDYELQLFEDALQRAERTDEIVTEWQTYLADSVEFREQTPKQQQAAIDKIDAFQSSLAEYERRPTATRTETAALLAQLKMLPPPLKNGDGNPLVPEVGKDPVLMFVGNNAARIKRWEMLGMFLVTTGGGFGLLCFGPLCERFGRRVTFLAYHLGGLAASLIAFQLLTGVGVLIATLPIFGFLTLGMHAGYAVYFPELYPTRLRGSGAGFCFNFGRILAAPILLLSGKMRDVPAKGGFGYSMEDAASVLCLLFLAGVLALVFAPETRGRTLPE
ncbi:MAG: MFS transporter [Planctomycetaceae bacterium]